MTEPSFPRSEIRVVLFEGISDTAAEAFREAGYGNVETHPRALTGDELVAAVRSLRREASRGGRRLRLPRLRANERADGGERAAAVAGKPGTQQKLGDLGI